MRNQLAVFQEIETDFGHRFDGTIIRLPLRTNDQASRSEVCKKPTTVQNIKEVFSKFKEEILETLLFLRNVRSITLKIGHAVFSSAEASSYHVPASGDRVPSNSSGEIQTPYLSVLVEKNEERWDDSFITEIKLLSGGKESMHTFAITHHMRHSVADTELGDWARKAKMFPWVAIAAPLNVSSLIAKPTEIRLIETSRRKLTERLDDCSARCLYRFIHDILFTSMECFRSRLIEQISITARILPRATRVMQQWGPGGTSGYSRNV